MKQISGQKKEIHNPVTIKQRNEAPGDQLCCVYPGFLRLCEKRLPEVYRRMKPVQYNVVFRISVRKAGLIVNIVTCVHIDKIM